MLSIRHFLGYLICTMKSHRSSLLIICSLLANYSFAVDFSAAIDQSKWTLEESQFYCRLQHEIPSFGRGDFFHEAGEQATFELIPTQKGSFAGGVKLVAEASSWQPGTAPLFINNINVRSGEEIIKIAAPDTADMLVALYKGMAPTFSFQRWMGSEEGVRVSLSAANFQKSYQDYIACVDKLLPVNYRQVARTAVLFPPAQWRLSDATKERLDLIAQYIKADAKVKSIYVDGHSDNAGRRLLNRDLSKQRAEEVTQYLISLGVDEKAITTRYHGERYPVVANNNATNRARNRRVTIRLERN